MGARLDDRLVELVDELGDFGSGPGGDLLDRGEPVFLVAWIDALRTVADEEVLIELESGLAFQDRHTDFFRAAGIDRGLVDHHIALLHRPAGLRQMHDAQARYLRRFQNHGTGALDIASRAHADDEVPASHTGYRHFHFGGPGEAIRRDDTSAAERETDEPGDDFGPSRVRLTQPLAGF